MSALGLAAGNPAQPGGVLFFLDRSVASSDDRYYRSQCVRLASLILLRGRRGSQTRAEAFDRDAPPETSPCDGSEIWKACLSGLQAQSCCRGALTCIKRLQAEEDILTLPAIARDRVGKL